MGGTNQPTTSDNMGLLADVNGTGGLGGLGGGFFPIDSSLFDVNWDSYMTPLSTVTLTIGFLANVWILAAGISRHQLRNSSFHLLLMNHSVANFVSCGFTYPVLVLRYSYGADSIVQDTSLCLVWSISICAITGVGLSSNGFLAINRAASCYPTVKMADVLRSRRTALVAVAIIWVLSALYFLVTAFVIKDSWKWVFNCVTVPEMIDAYIFKLSDPDLSTAKICMNAGLSVVSFVALIMCVVSYGVIIRYLLGQKMANNSDQRRKDNERALATIIIVFVIFFILRMPTIMLMIHDPMILLDYPILIWMPMFDCTVNPLVYLATMPTFRPKFLTKTSQTVRPSSSSGGGGGGGEGGGTPVTNVADKSNKA